jgi:hypothetical protein
MTKVEIKEAEDKLADAKRQGQAQFDSIREMVEELRKADLDAISEGPTEDGNYGEACESARIHIREDALSVQVRSGWYTPGAERAEQKAAEYEILLCTGGPACRIIGELSEHGEPETARMEVQDWFQPWTQIRPSVSPDDYDSGPILLEYARCFWFGE